MPDDRKGQSGAHGREVAPFDRNYEKLESSKIFKERLDAVKVDPEYLRLTARHRELYDPLVASKSKR